MKVLLYRAKIRNIEETEAAKLKLLKEAIEKKKSLSEKLTAQQNRVKDLAKNYVQHSICKCFIEQYQNKSRV